MSQETKPSTITKFERFQELDTWVRKCKEREVSLASERNGYETEMLNLVNSLAKDLCSILGQSHTRGLISELIKAADWKPPTAARIG